MPRDDDRRGPLPRLDAKQLELDGKKIRILLRLADIRIDTVDECGNDLLSSGMVVVELFGQVSSKHVESTADVALELSTP